jgi:acetyl esterase
MNQTEKLELAERCRRAGAFGSIAPEILNALPVQPVNQMIPAGERPSDVNILDGTKGKKGQPLLINLHGGGFIKARADRDTVYCSELADKFQLTVWDVDYVLAPEYPYPAAVNEAYDIAKYAYEHADEYGYDPERIFFLGHSAGSNLACAALIRNYREPAFRIKGMILDYIPVDQRINPFSKLEPEEYQDPKRVSRALMEYNYLELYMEPEQCIEDLASPAAASDEILASFPDTLIVTAGCDTLLKEGEDFACRLAKLGVPVTWKRFVNSRHGFTINRVDEWEAALSLHQRFLKGLI